MSDLHWSVWGFVQHAKGNPAEDFWSYGLERLGRSKTRMSSADFGRHLSVVRTGGLQLHRDLKPANILLDEEGNAYLADFGIAKDLGKRVSPYQTDASTVVGSPAYISPEQVRAEPITPQTDIYSLGVMLYEILTGQLPFQAPTPIALMFMHINEPVPPVRDASPRSVRRGERGDPEGHRQAPGRSLPRCHHADARSCGRRWRAARPSPARLTDAPPTPSQPEHGSRATSGSVDALEV